MKDGVFMADSITIKVSELYERAKQMQDDGMEYVKLSILDEDEVDDDIIPPSLWLNAFSDEEPGSIDYDGIESIDVD